ncbi:hypothetical protein [Candidatus Phyllobacterium onerii]|uniref:hypothetical protein n=1 Tax=Candidatus Phyllobacterium onerii TaxID=3020828 RepID=UPI002330444F|nr:hypothetical protein [Phyllobacterium sp. IY22]
MSLARFREEPWRTSHPAYQDSGLAMSPAPEYASSEVLLSSLYRHVGLEGATERTVPQRGREIDKDVQWYRDRHRKPEGAVLDPDAFHMLLHSVLESPKLPNQSSKRFVQVTPLVPKAAAFSGSARLSANSWPAGALVRRMIWLGSRNLPEAEATWQALFEALAVVDDDDIFARFLQAEIEAWAPSPKWGMLSANEQFTLDMDDQRNLAYPARRFARDLGSVIAAKSAMTRRQWTSLLESVLRLGAVAHVTWTCDLHARMWSCVRSALDGAGPKDIDEARALIFPRPFQFLSYGDRALPGMKDRASAFLQARLGLNATLWALDMVQEEGHGLSSAREVLDLCDRVRRNAAALATMGLGDMLAEVSERETRTLLCKKGIGSNIMEFARHVLGQRQAASPILRGYDQGFVLRKRSAGNGAPWIVGMGPVAILALVHCSLAGASGPRSVRRLSQHLSAYGISVDHRDIATNDLGHQLRMLGLVLDSPDAESGMLLVPPFPTVKQVIA